MEDYASEGRTKAIKRRLGTVEPPKPKKVEPPPLPIRIEPSSEDRSVSRYLPDRAWGDGYIERVEKIMRERNKEFEDNRYACRRGCGMDFPTDAQRIGHELRVHDAKVTVIENSKVFQAGEKWMLDLEVTFK